MRIKLHKPTATQKSILLSVLAGFGVVATGALSAKCAKKTADDMTVGQKLKAYAPALVAGGATIGCIGLSTYISHEQIALATAACISIGQKFADYRKSVEEVVSDEQREQIDVSFYEKEIDRLERELAERDHPTDEDDLCTFIDSFSGYTFKARIEQVESGLEEVNQHWKDDEYLSWCDIFYLINDKDEIPYMSSLGEGNPFDYGWGWSKRMFEEFDIDTENNFGVDLREWKGHPNTYFIDYPLNPEPGFMEY